MVILRTAVALLSVCCLYGVSARAQNTISLASSMTLAGSRAAQSCQEQAEVLELTLGRFPRPAKWHWIILCDDASWRSFLLRQDSPRFREASWAAGGQTIYASTDLGAHVTCLRGRTLLEPEDSRAKPEHVIAHELGHILLGTEDEDRAEQQALRWLGAGKERPGAGALPR